MPEGADDLFVDRALERNDDVEEFIQRYFMEKVSIILQSTYRHVYEFYVIERNLDPREPFRCTAVHLIDMDCPISI